MPDGPFGVLPFARMVGLVLEASGAAPSARCVCGHSRGEHGLGRCRSCPPPTAECPTAGCSHFYAAGPPGGPTIDADPGRP